MKKTVLIAGGAGFVGSHLCDRYLEEGWMVVCVDNLSTGSLSNVNHNLMNKLFKLEMGDIRKKSEISRLDYKLDLVINMACPASPEAYLKRPIETMETCSIGTKNLLDLAHRNNAYFLQASTSEVYGDPLEHPQRERYFGNVDLESPRAVYDEGKRYAETLCFEYARSRGVRVDVVRLFNTYGPRMAYSDGRVLPNFLASLKEDAPMSIYGDGIQTRSFCYVSDTVDAIMKIAGNGFCEPINIGNDDEISIINFAKRVAYFWYEDDKKVPNFSFKPLPESDPKVRRPDISKIKDLVGWEPAVELNVGLCSTIADYKKHHLR